MSDFPKTPVLSAPVGVVSTTNPAHCASAAMAIAASGLFSVSTAWGTANLAVYVPVRVGAGCRIYKMSVLNGTVVAGTADVGIYNEDGARLVSSGPTTQAGTSAVQTFDITDTPLHTGFYFLALASSDATATFTCANMVSTARSRVCAVLQETGLTSGTLAATATFATCAQTFAPIIVAHARSVV